jgi:hypothetical protein
MYRGICLFALLALASAGMASPQNTEIKIHAVNGQTGKPLSGQRLIIFGGESAEAATLHHTAFDVTTDERGLAELKFDTKARWIQVWADGMTLCQTKPNSRSFSVDAILTTGLSAPNTCSSLVQAATPGYLTVFVRASNLREKMER